MVYISVVSQSLQLKEGNVIQDYINNYYKQHWLTTSWLLAYIIDTIDYVPRIGNTRLIVDTIK